jgi:arginyl-tRNA synthetase
MKNHLRNLLARAIGRMEGGELRMSDLPPLLLEPPKQREFGDLATNLALIWAKHTGKSPRAVAEAILKNLDDSEGLLERAEVAGPGFLNFYFSRRFYYRCLAELDREVDFKIDVGRGEKVQVEFASANPTGPLHVGHGRVAVIGDVLARLLTATGYRVEREYYVNDAGNQMAKLGESIYARYRELFGEEVVFPEDGYPGEYVRELARAAKDEWGDRFLADGDAVSSLSRFGGARLLDVIRGDLALFGIRFDSFVSEGDLRARDEVGKTIALLEKCGLIYEREGVLWFNAVRYGDDKDRAVRKSDGELTYFASDIAYHRSKFERGFSRLVNVWGADHHGYVKRLKAAIAALGYDPERLRVTLVQMVHLTRGGEPVKMGKRQGEFVTLREVLEEVGKDAARFFFLMRKADSHLDFDLELAKRESADNPVFYVQYAHARVASVFQQARQRGIDPDREVGEGEKLERLVLPEEIELIKKAVQFGDVVEQSVKELEPHHVTFYLLSLAGDFHRYYNRCRILSEDDELTRARLVLVRNVQKVIRGGLGLLGVEAPVKMAARSESGLADAQI